MLSSSNEGIAILALIWHASPLVQGVIALLLLASFISWTMIFRKWFALRSSYREMERFEQRFWSGGNMEHIYVQYTSRGRATSGVATIFVDGLKEFKRLRQQKAISPNDIMDGVQRAMRVALSREIDSLETHLAFLATVGSTSPYVGLFGTVWGIMNSFMALGAVQQATIAHVAPGIAEALIATAMGLFAAIPAVIAYNRYSNKVERLVSRYEIFMDEFSSIVQRQSFTAKAAAI